VLKAEKAHRAPRETLGLLDLKDPLDLRVPKVLLVLPDLKDQ
jgi:hypothetical protein